jgi:Flp pilus assembly protein TadD
LANRKTGVLDDSFSVSSTRQLLVEIDVDDTEQLGSIHGHERAWRRRMTTGQDARLIKRAISFFQDGQHPEAARLCREILAHSPCDNHALEMLGMIEGMAGNAVEARQLLEQANRLRPRNPPLLNNLAIACQSTGDHDTAVMHCREALRADPSFAGGWYTLAVNQWHLGDTTGALDSYKHVTTLQPNNADAWANRADISERLNQLEEAAADVNKALEVSPQSVMANLVAAKIDLRRDKPESCRLRMEELITKGGLSPNHEAIARQHLGLAFDRLDDQQQAFGQFTLANKILARDYDAAFQAGGGPYSLAAVRRTREFLQASGTRKWHPVKPADDPASSIFLMGFPRSGTTLVERILDMLDVVDSLEERETLVDLQRDFVMSAGGLKGLESLTPETQLSYRQAYRRRVADWKTLAPGRSLVDKLPLNTMFLPLIYRIFPDARVVFAIRDPRDVCLSCFMQNFALNEAMSYFLDLELTVEYYIEVMETGLAALEALPIAAHRIRYEDLVRDPETQCRALLDFLNIEWSPIVLDFHQHQKGRQIQTPSYLQVAQPLYENSIGRWRKYADQMEPHLERLQPLAEKLGYS